MIKKLAIVSGGGGTKCSYSAGALCALAEEHGIKNPEIVVGSSGSTGSLAYYVAGQYFGIENIWTNLLASKNFISFARINKILNIDYLIDAIFKEKERLNCQKIIEAEIKFFIAVTEYVTGKGSFFSDYQKIDIFEAMRASKAVPFFYGKRVEINGIKYTDGSISSPISRNIKKAIEEGAKNIIVIQDDDNKKSLWSVCFWKAYSFFVSSELRAAIEKYLISSLDVTEFADINIVLIAPTEKKLIGPLSSNRNKLRASFDLGYRDVKDNPGLKAFLKRC